MGLIDEKYYQEKRNALLSKYLESGDEIAHVSEEDSRSQYSDRSERIYRAVLISLLVIGIVLFGIVIGTKIYPFITTPTYTTSVIIERPVTVTKEYVYTVTQMVTEQFIRYNQASVYEGPSNIPEERIIHSGPLYIEKNCRMNYFSIDAEKGDVIEVYWEADDDDARVAIGTPADISEKSSHYCEVLMAFWRYSWPVADYGYSGSLRFTVPSSGTWYVIVANGNTYCASKCPITFTRLEIKHIKS